MKDVSLNERLEFLNEMRNVIEKFDVRLEHTLRKAKDKNPWFTQDSMTRALRTIKQNYLNSEELNSWYHTYHKEDIQNTIGIVMAGNIPMVGLHDFIAVFLSGAKSQIKCAAKDDELIPFILNEAAKKWPKMLRQFSLVPKLKGFDAVIATGSNNSARYFEYYFAKDPRMIRKNRTSVAILDGSESEGDFKGLTDDVFSYFGLGCRNVSKLYLPKGYDLELILKPFKQREEVILHSKYANNYKYNYAVYVMNKIDFMTNGSIMLRMHESIHSPLSVVHYEFYEDKISLYDDLESLRNEIQCVVSNTEIAGWRTYRFGATQSPSLTDYADGADTMAFLAELPQ